MKISVVTACFNSAATIALALESVAAQSHPQVEHIVVDGGSTDGTLERVAAHRGRLAAVLEGPDRGIYDALNKGIRAASGEVVAFLHSDDVYAHPDVLASVAAEMQARSLQALYGDVAFFRGEDRARIVRRYSSRRFRPARIGWGWMPAHPALFMARALYERFGLYKTDYAIAGDFEFIARAFARPDFAYAYRPEVLVKMRLGGASNRGWRSALTIHREFLRACRENAIPTSSLRLLSRYPAKALELVFPGR